jgi:hypothetical protein
VPKKGSKNKEKVASKNPKPKGKLLVGTCSPKKWGHLSFDVIQRQGQK